MAPFGQWEGSSSPEPWVSRCHAAVFLPSDGINRWHLSSDIGFFFFFLKIILMFTLQKGMAPANGLPLLATVCPVGSASRSGPALLLAVLRDPISIIWEGVTERTQIQNQAYLKNKRHMIKKIEKILPEYC